MPAWLLLPSKQVSLRVRGVGELMIRRHQALRFLARVALVSLAFVATESTALAVPAFARKCQTGVRGVWAAPGVTQVEDRLTIMP